LLKEKYTRLDTAYLHIR